MFNENEPYFIKKTKDNYVSEKYRCEWIVDKNKNMIGVEFNHHEKITIPKEMFVGQSGKIAFLIFGNDINDLNYESKQLSTIWIYYAFDGNKVTISEKEN